MSESELVRSYPEFFVSEVCQDMLWVRFSGNFFHNITNFDKRDFLADYLDMVKREDLIRTVVFQTNYRESGIDEYTEFFLAHTGELSYFGGARFLEINRFSNIINQLALNVMELNKFTVQLCSGAALSLFMNLGFSCDYRIISDDTVFHNAYKKIGGLPIGGGPFFLSRLLGRSRANKLLLLHDTITADQALDYGIVDQVTTPEGLEGAAIDAAEKIRRIHPRTVSGVKRLTSITATEFREYLGRETEELQRVCVQMGKERSAL